jgi:molybdopterin-guanine dinucleotide biosynthesis adapter protein
VLRVVGIVGYKSSGKTTLARTLARELAGRSHEVAVIKHSSHPLDLPGKDTAVLGEAAGQVGFISPQETAVFWKKPLSLENIIPYLEADIVLVEGFKQAKTFPKIVCLGGAPDDTDRDRLDGLFDGLAICTVGPADQVEEKVSNCPISTAAAAATKPATAWPARSSPEAAAWRIVSPCIRPRRSR